MRALLSAIIVLGASIAHADRHGPVIGLGAGKGWTTVGVGDETIDRRPARLYGEAGAGYATYSLAHEECEGPCIGTSRGVSVRGTVGFELVRTARLGLDLRAGAGYTRLDHASFSGVDAELQLAVTFY